MPHARGSWAAAFALALVALGLGACSADDADHEPDQRSSQAAGSAAAERVPELEREWQITAYATIPQSWNEHYWLTDFSYTRFDAAGTSSIGTGLKMFDAQTGERVELDLGGHACGVPDLHPGDTHAVVTVSAEPPDTYYSKADHLMGSSTPPRQCTGLVVYDATTGRKAWQWPVGSAGTFRYDGDAFGAVMVTYPNGKAGCFNLADGRRLSTDYDRRCVFGRPYLPPLLDEHGAALKKLSDQEEIARIDGVLVVSGQLPDQSTLVRAHDLETGLTLWADAVDLDPSPDASWRRSETYATSPDSLLRIRYEFEQDEDDPDHHVPTYAFISRVEPRTGEELSQVGTVAQGLLLAQVGDMAVMGVDQDKGFKAHLAGFRIPPSDTE